ncbi:MAG: hypothetical protein ACKN9T_03650 [Candidatus Methylumidiphilus sp.]
MISRLALLAQVCLVLLFAYAQYHGMSFLGSDEERAPPGSSRSSFHK